MSEISSSQEIPKRQVFHDLPREEQQERVYFGNVSRSVFNELKLHSAIGLWQRNVKGERDWGNVSEHCLVEVARVSIFVDLLGFSHGLKQDLLKAAALHDFFKKGEREILEAKEFSWEAMEEAETESERRLEKAGFSKRAVRLAGSVGHNSLQDIQEILQQNTLSPDEIAFLVMHYVDDITVNSEWGQPAQTMPDGSMTNDLDRRMDKAEVTPRYVNINQEGKNHIDGETAFHAQRRIGHIVEKRLASLIYQNSGQQIEPFYLPEYIDGIIKADIAKVQIKQKP